MERKCRFALICVLSLVSIWTTFGHNARELLIPGGDGSLNVNLTSIGYSYAVPIIVGNRLIELIVDTGNNQFTVLDNGYRPVPPTTTIGFVPSSNFVALPHAVYPCLALMEDNVLVNYLNMYDLDGDCYGATGSIQLLNGTSTKLEYVTFSIASQLVTQNTSKGNLHPWGQGGQGGNMGMGYEGQYKALNATVFGALVEKTSQGQNGVFGLDFNAINASMQIGGLKQAYVDTMQWARQGYDNPHYHNIMIKNLGVCNAKVGLFGVAPGLNSYRVMVDTGQVCLQLPSEIYEALMNWLDSSFGAYPTMDSLPFLSFQVDNGNMTIVGDIPSRGDLLYIRLSDLLVSPDDMGPSDSGNDGPPITVGGVDYKLCIMVFGNMFASQVDDTLNAGSPPIIFGSLPLRSVYFAADMSTRSVGFANKFDISFINAMYSTSKCQAAATCIGQQNYNPVTNLCNAPTCDDYFFAYLDETTQNCYNRLDLYNAGLTIIWLCIIMETVSFFVMQYSGLQVMGIENDDFRYTRVMNTQVDSFTYHVGKGMSHVLDLVSEFINDYTTVPP